MNPTPPTTSRILFVCLVAACFLFLVVGEIGHSLVCGIVLWLSYLLHKAYALPPPKRVDMAAHMHECAIRDAARSARRSHLRYEADQRRDPEGKRYSGPPPLP